MKDSGADGLEDATLDDIVRVDKMAILDSVSGVRRTRCQVVYTVADFFVLDLCCELTADDDGGAMHDMLCWAGRL